MHDLVKLAVGVLLILSGLPLWKLASADDFFESPAITEHWLGEFAMRCLFVLTCVAMVVLPMIGVFVLTSI
jgi:hypothetical protein